MSFNQHSFEKHFVINGSAPVLVTGTTANLAGGQVGFFSRDGKTTFTLDQLGNYRGEVKIGVGSWHTKDSLYEFWGGMKKSDGTKAFRAQFVTALELHRPVKPIGKKVSVGYNGVLCCSPVVFDCNKGYRLRLELRGKPVYRTFHHDFHKDYFVQTPCCDPCAEGCTAGEVDARFVFESWVRQINSDPMVNKFVKAKLKVQNYASTAGAVSYTKYQLSVCDEGDAYALAIVQQQYPTIPGITKIARNGAISVYEVIRLTSAGAPGAFQPIQEVALPVCITCPVGWTTTVAQDVYLVKRALVAADDLNSPGDQATFAAAVATAYSATASTFISNQDGAFAIIELRFTAGTVVTPIGSDVVTFIKADTALCTPPAAATIAWAANGTLYKVSRVQCLTVAKDCSGGDRLAAVQAFYAGWKDLVANSIIVHQSFEDVNQSTQCGDIIQIGQYNNAYLQDGCFEQDLPEYDQVPPFEGLVWTDCSDCDPDAPAPETNCVGMVIYSIYTPDDEQFSEAAFEFNDIYDTEPIDFTTMLYDESGKVCDRTVLPVTILNEATRAQGTGYNAFKEYVQHVSGYKLEEWSDSPRIREICDYVSSQIIKRKKYYKLYKLSHYIPNNHASRAHFEQEHYTYYFWLSEDSVQANSFEQFLRALAEQSGTQIQVF